MISSKRSRQHGDLGLRAWGPCLGPSSRRPNFVFFLIDDLGWQDLGCYGSTFYETPNIDRLAAQGMRFTNAYAACPVCSPTRASILTGKYPARLRLTDWIPAAPHRQAALGRVPPLPAAGGGDARRGAEGGGLRDLLRRQVAPGRRAVLAGEAGFRREHRRLRRRARRRPTSTPISGATLHPRPGGRPEGEYLTDRLTDEALKLIEQNEDRPFLLYLSHYAVHIPMQAKKELAEKYEAKASSWDWRTSRTLPRRRLARDCGRDDKSRSAQDAHPPGPRGVRGAWCESLDESVGRVMEKLDELGLRRTTRSSSSRPTTAAWRPSEGQPDLQPAAAGGQGLALRRRHPRADAHQVAGRDQAGQHLRRAGDQHRFLPDDAGDGGPAAEAAAARGRREHGAAAQGTGRQNARRSTGTTRTTATRAAGRAGPSAWATSS